MSDLDALVLHLLARRCSRRAISRETGLPMCRVHELVRRLTGQRTPAGNGTTGPRARPEKRRREDDERSGLFGLCWSCGNKWPEGKEE